MDAFERTLLLIPGLAGGISCRHKLAEGARRHAPRAAQAIALCIRTAKHNNAEATEDTTA